jgi:hypothetical protein
MIKIVGLSFAVMLMLGSTWGQTETLKVKPKNDALDVCVPSYVGRYAALCETAEIVARGVAYACSPKPIKPISSDKYQAITYAIDEAAHEQAYAKALVAILDARAQKPQACARR